MDLNPNAFKDFDASVSEVDDRFEKFKFGGEDFEVNLNVDAGELLRWMEHGSKVEAIPKLLRLFLEEEDYERLLKTGQQWNKMEALVAWLAEKLGDSGN